MRGCVGLIVCTSLGCNWLYGLQPTELAPPIDADRPDADPRADLDRDGIKDIGDPCIAPAVDALYDDDKDGIANGLDSCPFDAGDTGDPDGDGVADACDPFDTPGDRVRCLMVMSDPDMNVRMWKPRDDVQPPWVLYEPRVIYGRTGSIVADWPFEGPATTTLDVTGQIGAPLTGPFAMLVRAAAAPSATDLGCEIASNGGGWTLAIVPGGAPTAVQAPTLASNFRLRITIEAQNSGAVNLRCVLRIAAGPSYITSAQVPLPGGHLGFRTMTAVSFRGIAIYERDDAPGL